ncbi:hypothetical protein ACKC9G_18525 [Pokkaliibacter sp. CJK22405]|uniref:hypothetical protein n=1 Tax=Pokkaliibacter sp. CJK22405 TaxID=3384615 RepID=UPI0039846850
MTAFCGLGYGLINQQHALDTAVAVCDVIGHGSNRKAVHLVLETCAQETHLGQYPDPTVNYAGAGLAQCDRGTFDWLQAQYSSHPLATKLRQRFDVHLEKVQYAELYHSPLIAMIFCRLRFFIVPSLIPDDLEGRAAYWKKWYNSTAGKGQPEEYIKNAALAAPLIEQFEAYA